ncbi:V-type ATP synthase subunit F, partial [Dysosmobacter welbionis]
DGRSAAARPGALSWAGNRVRHSVLCDPPAAVPRHLRPGLQRGEVHPPQPGGAAAQAALGLLRQAGSGGPDRDPHGRCEPHGARLVPCAGIPVRRLHLHGHYRGLPAG